MTANQHLCPHCGHLMKDENARKLWSPSEDAVLRSMYKDGAKYIEIAVTLSRPESSITSRVNHLALPRRLKRGRAK